MPGAIWKGSISFGLVNIPVGLYSAEKREELSFHLLDRRNMARVRYQKVNEETGKEVPWDETVRGYEYEKNHYVVLTDEDLKRASPEATQSIDLLDFVDVEEISPLYFDKPYYLGPDKKGARAYALLRETLRRTAKAGIAKVVLRTKQYLAAVVARGDVLTLEILRYAHELRDPGELDVPAGDAGVSERELEMAERLVEGMVEDWDPEKYKDTYRDDLMKMIEKRVEAGQTEGSDEPAPAPRRTEGKVLDLMALLKQSVEQRGVREDTEEKKKPARKTARKPARKAPAKKAAPKKAARKSPSAAKKRKSA